MPSPALETGTPAANPIDLVEEVVLANEWRHDRSSDEEFYRVAAKTPRSNCVMDITKLLSAGVKIRPVGEALEHSLINWQPEHK